MQVAVLTVVPININRFVYSELNFSRTCKPVFVLAMQVAVFAVGIYFVGTACRRDLLCRDGPGCAHFFCGTFHVA